MSCGFDRKRAVWQAFHGGGFGYVLGANHTFITCFSKLGDFPLFISGSVIASFLFADQ